MSSNRVTPLHVIADFGGVLGLPQPPETFDILAGIVGMTTGALVAGYPRRREDYDRGLDDQTYWSEVVGRQLSHDEVKELTQADLRSYLTPNKQSLLALRRAKARGARVTLLSNAPHSQVRLMHSMPELAGLFDREVFSADHGVAKPDPAIYRIAVGGCPAVRTVFVDDREENLVPARHLGWDTIHFAGAGDLDARLRALQGADR